MILKKFVGTFISIKAIPMNQGREKAVGAVIFTFSGIYTHKPGKSGKMVLDNSHPRNSQPARWV